MTAVRRNRATARAARRSGNSSWTPVEKELQRIRRVYERALREIAAAEAKLSGVVAPLTKSQRAFAGAELVCIREEYFPTRRRTAGADQIYFIQSGPGGPIKIGWTKNVRRRLRALQTSSAARLEILAVCDGDKRLEAELHRRLAAYRQEGEWFIDCAEVRALMSRLTAPEASTP